MFEAIRRGTRTRYAINKLNEDIQPQTTWKLHKQAFDWFWNDEIKNLLKILNEEAKSNGTQKIFIKKISFKPANTVGTPEHCRKSHTTYAADLFVTFDISGKRKTEKYTPKDFTLPILTDSCTFIIFGKDKVYINQLRKAEKKNPNEELSNKKVITIGQALSRHFKAVINYFNRTPKTEDNYREKFQDALTKCLAPLFKDNVFLQPLEKLNPLAIASQFNTLTNMGKGGLTANAGFTPRDVKNSYFGRLCPIETPEGKNCGLIHHLSLHAMVDIASGTITTPYKNIQNNDISYFSSSDEENIFVAGAKFSQNNNEKVLAKVGNQISNSTSSDIHFSEVSTDQMLAYSAALIPFLEHDDGHRALMAASMQKQAVPLLNPEAPIVATGREYQLAQDISDLNLLTDETAIDNGELALGKNLLVAYIPYQGYNYEDGIVISSELVDNDILTTHHKYQFSCNLNDRTPLVTEDELLEKLMEEIPGKATSHLDENCIIRVGTVVTPGMLLVGKLIPGHFSDTPISNRIFGGKDYVDGSLYADSDTNGIVTSIQYYDKDDLETKEIKKATNVIVSIEEKRKIKIGDKLAGRHGNKGVVTRIKTKEKMPYIKHPDGRKEYIQVLLNPLGVPSRMNLGQLYEAHLGWIARELGTLIQEEKISSNELQSIFKSLPEVEKFGNYMAIPFAAPAFNGPSLTQIQELYHCANLDESCKTKLHNSKNDQPYRNPVTNEPYPNPVINEPYPNPIANEPYPNPVTVGIAYMMKLDHLVDDKISVRSSGKYAQITEQPPQGRNNDGGQRLGEMELWALEAHGAINNLKECLTVKSDDIAGREKAEYALRKGINISNYGLPESFKYLVKTLNALCFDVIIKNDDKNTINIDEISSTLK